MYLKNLHLINFKSYPDARIDFYPGINCLTGPNGSGKTNLLDAIHYLCFCKSFLNSFDYQNIRHGAENAIIQGEFDSGVTVEHIFCSILPKRRKIFKRNGKDYERLADHIGLLPMVIIAPEDGEIITGGSEERRKLADTIISQSDPVYLDHLIQYYKSLEQRNRLLKHFALSKSFDRDALEGWNLKLLPAAGAIYQKRTGFIKEIIPLFQKFYRFLCDTEQADIGYESQLHHSSMEELLAASLQKDKVMEHTTTGIHKDDFIFRINGHPVKRFGSQGQQKSFIIALKLAVHRYLLLQKKIPPVLLLDDIFAKLDNQRISQLVQIIGNIAEKEHTNCFGQIVITDTDAARVNEILTKHGIGCNMQLVEKTALPETDYSTVS